MKLDCYIVKDLLPIYIDKLTSNKTDKDIKDHLQECENCNKEYEQMIKPMSVSDTENQNNTKEVHYFKKCKKKYSTMVKLLIIIAVICALLFAGLVITLTSAYHQQYNNKAVSNNMCISINDNEGIDFIGEYDDYKIYTYNLEEAYFIDFFANRIEIEDAFKNGKTSIKDMTKHLEITNLENNKVYTFEGYQIILSKDICVIAPISIQAKDVIQTVNEYISD